MELKYCSRCHDLKLETEFFKNKRFEDGLDYYCKTCRVIVNRKKRHKPEDMDLSYIKISYARPKDYHDMYLMLEKMGYDLNSEKSIHEQFCDKYGLEPIKRDKPFNLHLSWNQLKKNPQ